MVTKMFVGEFDFVPFHFLKFFLRILEMDNQKQVPVLCGSNEDEISPKNNRSSQQYVPKLNFPLKLYVGFR